MRRIMTIMTVLILGSAAAPAFAQKGTYEPLFDTFNFRLEGSFVTTNTEIRFDSKELGQGTTLSFEDDLGLDGRTMTPSLSFEWQMGRRHRLDYTYYPWIKERWAVGFGLGLRTLSILAAITVEGELVGQSGGADFTAPLPYINFEYRRMLSAKWRMRAGLGYFYLAIGNYSGWQGIVRLSVEHNTFKNVGFGVALNGSEVVADADSEEFFGQVDIGINDISFFIRIRL